MEAKRVLHAADLPRWTPNASAKLQVLAAVPHTVRVLPTSGVLKKPVKLAAKVAKTRTVVAAALVATNVTPTETVNQTRQHNSLKCAGCRRTFFIYGCTPAPSRPERYPER